jgi:2-polyprenyl-3-methyl-5-hydroxy-6-metoxy-1,4-benzoquinol methylase
MSNTLDASAKWLRSFISTHLYWPFRLVTEKGLFEIVSVALRLEWVRVRIASRTINSSPAQSHRVGSVDNLLALWLTKAMCYSGRDVRAAWPVVGTPFTNVKKYRPWARWAHQHLTMYRFFFDQVASQSQVLDLGGGIGNMAANLADLRPDIHVTVIDLDPLSVRIGAELFQKIPNLDFVNEDARSSKYVSRFDYCFMIELLEHVTPESHISLIETALSALKPNGKLFLTTPNAIDQKDEPWGHIGLLNLERAKELAKVFEDRIIKFGYLSSESLTSEDPRAYSAVDDIKHIDVPRSEFSHYFFELRNTQT